MDSVTSFSTGPPVPRPPTLDLGSHVVRPMAVADADDVLEMLTDPDVVAARSLPPPADLDGARDWIDRALDDPGCVAWVIERAADGRAVGYVALQSYDAVSGVSDVGYLVIPSDRRQGVASRALIAITDWAFSELDVHRIALVHDADNPASCGVARSAGFAVEGVLRSARRRLDGSRVDLELHARVRSDPGSPTASGD